MRTIPTLLAAACLAMPFSATAGDVTQSPHTDDKYEHLFYNTALEALRAGHDPVAMFSHANDESLFAAAMARAAAEYDDGAEVSLAAPGTTVPTPVARP